ncbi:ABC transporter permease subunit [Thermogladius sp. KZ2Tp1]|uniref:PstA family ABC transporter permease n=1 Tax=Thermogladius sp. KZ2Tp1 TaxID=3136289 RepID=UPI003DAA2365
MSRRRSLKVALVKASILTSALVSLTLILVVHIVVVVYGLPLALLNGLSLLYATPPLPNQDAPVGGVGPSLVGTLVSSGIAVALATPVALIAAFTMVEYKGRWFVDFLRVVFTSLYGLPTITISVIVYSLLVIPMRAQSLLAGSLSLALVALPVEISYLEGVFSSIPETYREAGYAIGLTRWLVLKRVLIGIGKSGVASTVALTLARVMGETAPLLFTIGNAINTYPSSLYSLLQPSSTITTLIFTLSSSPFPSQFQFAWAASLVLYVVYAALFALSRMVRGVEL